MKHVWLVSSILVSVGIAFGVAQYVSFLELSSTAAPSTPTPSEDRPQKRSQPRGVPTATESAIEYKSYNLPSSIVHVLRIPTQKFVVTPVLADGVETVQTIAQKHGAIAVLNGGFFDPENQKSTSFVTVQGKLVADPRSNERLVNNPDLAPYLDKIFNRSEFRRYQCGEAVEYAIAFHRQTPSTNCQITDALGGGPQLGYENDTALLEGFFVYSNGRLVRDSIGRREPNARTAIGLTSNGVVWVMVAQKPNSPTSGMSLETLSKFMMDTQGTYMVLNLDGGSSSSLYYNGKAFYGKVDETGKPIKRPVKSVLLVKVKKVGNRE